MENKTNEENQKEQPAEPPKDQIVVTRRSILMDGKTIPYTVTCGTIVLKEEALKKGEKEGEFEGEKPRAEIFFIAYTREDVQNQGTRPLTFSFNGGPGSSSVWLHLGALGPRRVEMGDADALLPPPYGLADNAWSLLDVTDLVFIDPVSTGYSRAVSGEKPKQFHGFKRDIESVGDFIRLYATRYQRWNSPKFLVGESYGTTRAAGLSGYLQDRHGMYLNGLMLVSAALNFQTLEFDPGNELPYLLFLPTYTATAWYHRRLATDLQAQPLEETLAGVRKFAQDEYSPALFQGDSLEPAERRRIARKLSRWTGLTEAYLERANLRIEIFRFTKELLRDERRTVGRLDSRFKGIDRDAAGERFEHDPSMSAILGPYATAFNHYVRSELGYESDLPYETLSSLYQTWSYAEHENRYVDVAETLRKAVAANPALRVLVANGYYDLATPFFATEYTVNHLALEASLRSNLQMKYYPAGHMMYLHQPSLEKLKTDLAEFIRQSA